eukprot:2861-Heterococcus_DN1.PRE.3
MHTVNVYAEYTLTIISNRSICSACICMQCITFAGKRQYNNNTTPHKASLAGNDDSMYCIGHIVTQCGNTRVLWIVKGKRMSTTVPYIVGFMERLL